MISLEREPSHCQRVSHERSNSDDYLEAEFVPQVAERMADASTRRLAGAAIQRKAVATTSPLSEQYGLSRDGKTTKERAGDADMLRRLVPNLQHRPADAANVTPSASATFPVQGTTTKERVGYAAMLKHLVPQVQPKSDSAIESTNAMRAAAANGVATPAKRLPHAEKIQAAFGPEHDISQIRAHIDPESTRAMGAQAYATGNDVVFASEPDEELAAHEAAHVVQQAGGVRLKDGVGEAGDLYERNADAVAARVKSGQSARDLLPTPNAEPATNVPAPGEHVQRKEAQGSKSSSTSSDITRGPVSTTAEDITQNPLTAEVRKPADGPGIALSDAEQIMMRTREFARTTGDVLLPAFRKAVDALDAPGALQLAQACAQGLRAVLDGRDQARTRVRDANPAARASCGPDHDIDAPSSAPVEAWELDVHKELEQSLSVLDVEVRAFGIRTARELSPQLFRGLVVGSGMQVPPGAETHPYETAVREASTTVDLVITFNHIRDLLWPVPWLAPADKKKEAVSKIEMWRNRPINFQFLKQVLIAERLWDVLASQSGESGRSLTTTAEAVDRQAKVTGDLGDVGEWDAARVNSLLSRGIRDWAVTDEDAQKVYDMIASAAPAVRGQLVLQLDSMGKLGVLCENLPWRWVEQLHDVIDNPAARAKLRPFFENKGGGESLSKIYERKIMENLEEGNYVRAFAWTFLDTAHSGLTFGFKDLHDSAYDAREAGLISDDAYFSTTAKGVGRAAALMAATAVTGGAAGAWGEGAALGLGAGKTTAQIIGGAIGGGAGGVSGQFAGDVYDQALLGKQGFSTAREYGLAALFGAGSGALTASIQPAGSKYLEKSIKTMSQIYAERYPGLDNVLTRIRNAGVREGLVLRVTAQELKLLASSGLTNPARVSDALARFRKVLGNKRIDVNTRTLAKVHPQSEIQKYYGDVDPATGRVTVRNQNPTSTGYVADAESIPASSKTTDASMRDVLGIDGPIHWYKKYKVANDPLFEVTFKVNVELDVPLPQTEAPGTPLGTMNARSHHVAGAGRTKGGVPEGILPPGTPIEIVDIRPVGTPRASYPTVPGAHFSPSAPAAPSVRNLAAPLSGATAGIDAIAQSCVMQNDDLDHD